MFWKKKQPEVKPEVKPEMERMPFALKLRWVDGTPETLEEVIHTRVAPALLPFLVIVFKDKHQIFLNINQLKSGEAIGAEPIDLAKYSK